MTPTAQPTDEELEAEIEEEDRRAEGKKPTHHVIPKVEIDKKDPAYSLLRKLENFYRDNPYIWKNHAVEIEKIREAYLVEEHKLEDEFSARISVLKKKFMLQECEYLREKYPDKWGGTGIIGALKRALGMT